MRRSTGTLAEQALPRAEVRIPLEIRALAYSDLPEVIAIERRAFPAPWSLAMFVLELSKPASICVGAVSNSELAAI